MKLFFCESAYSMCLAFAFAALSLAAEASAGAEKATDQPVTTNPEQLAPMAGPYKPDTPVATSSDDTKTPQKSIKGMDAPAVEEPRVRARVQARWDALIQMDMERVYSFATPSYRKANNLRHLNNQYAGQVKRDSIEIHSVRFEETTPPTAKVDRTLFFTIEGFQAGTQMQLDSFETETWVKVDDEWWYVEPR